MNEYEQIHKLCTSSDKQNWELGRALMRHVDVDKFAQYVVDCFFEGKQCKFSRRESIGYGPELEEYHQLIFKFENRIIFNLTYIESLYIASNDNRRSVFRFNWGSAFKNSFFDNFNEIWVHWHGVKFSSVKNRLLLLKNLKTIVIDLIEKPNMRIDYAYVSNLLGKSESV